ncbi:FAD-dependent oxidoreductase [Nocardiopsis alba]|uniref:FAD-dependent oxidoreductase n=1 Tax=Nocardiopsis alba TaxID=53437 RepID=UPI00363AB8C0
MHVLVAGAGIAGAAAALALGNQGHRIIVLERAPAARDGGCAIVLWSNGTAVLKDLGVDPTALGERIEAVDVYSARGRALMSVDTTRLETRFDAPVLGVPRRNLHRRLLRDLPEEILHYGARLTHVHEGEDHVRVRTSEGREYTADLLIGADGVNSAVRAALPGPLPEAETTGAATWQGLTSTLPLDLASRSRLYMGRRGGVGFNPAGRGRVQWLIDLRHTPDVDLNRPDRALPLLREHYAGWAEPVTTLLAHLTEHDLELFPHRRHRVGRRWGHGRVLLIGDAAHAMPPILAQGAGQALEDVSLLTRLLPTADLTTRAGREALQHAYPRRRARQARLASTMATRGVATSGPRTLAQSEAALRGAALLPSGLPTRVFEGLMTSVSERLRAGAPVEQALPRP